MPDRCRRDRRCLRIHQPDRELFRVGGRRRRQLVGHPHPRRQRRQRLAHRGRLPSRSRDDDEVRAVEDGRELVPRRNICKRVGAGDEEHLRRRPAFRREPRERATGVRRAVGVQLAVVGQQSRRFGDAERHHREAVLGRCRRLLGAMWRDVRRNQMDDVEIERGLGGKRDGKMAVMERVESTTEEAETAGAGHSLVEDTRLRIGDCRLEIAD